MRGVEEVGFSFGSDWTSPGSPMKGNSDQKYSFDGFTLDLPRACLLRGEQQIRLRPKSFEVLTYLVRNSGRLVTKTELIQAVWPDSFVTDDSLVQCLIDVRRALGGDAQRYIKTVPRRGYIFDLQVRETVQPAPRAVFAEQVEGLRVVIEEVVSPPKTSFGKTLSNIIRVARSLSWRAGIIIGSLLIVGALALLLYRHNRHLRWAEASLSRVEELAQEQKYFGAYDLATLVQKYLPRNDTLARLMPIISDDLSVATEPVGGRVYLKRFAPDESGKFPPRQFIGAAPITHLQIGRGEYIIYIEKDGYAPLERTISSALNRAESTFQVPAAISINEKLIEADRIPNRMVFVPGGEYRLVSWSQPTDASVRLDDYFIDKFEVSNREYKEFINAGGYLKKQFWNYPIIKDGKQLPWEQAVRELTDRTALPGPRSWSNQNFPEGKAEHPVTDITWYEAAAYAAFRSKQLPTIFQWEKAARNGAKTHFNGLVMPWGRIDPTATVERRANFKGSGTAAVDSLEFGMSSYGCYNMAGNVAEWCLNEQPEGFTTVGGSWEDPAYLFGYFGSFPGFYSSASLGFRCALNSPNATGDQGAIRINTEQEIPTYTPASDLSFKALAAHYRYDHMPLDAQVIEVLETDAWRREKVTFLGANDERAIGYLYLPTNFQRPLQVIQFVPGDDVFYGRPVPEYIETLLGPYIKSGRAVFGVVLKGYIERKEQVRPTSINETTVKYREHMVNWATDLRRGLDYLETRDDIDSGKIAYCGVSGGASRDGLIFAAIEPRYRSVILMGGGLHKYMLNVIPEANPINFAQHIRAPKLMLSGRYDEVMPYKRDIEPLYKLLPEPKRLALFDGGHFAPLEIAVPIVNGWLDETLGPVKRE